MDGLVIEASQDNLALVLAFVDDRLAAAGCQAKLRRQLAVVTEEIFVNIASYAYAPNTGSAEVRVEAAGEEAAIEFEDGGKPYNPLEKEDPDIRAGLDDRDVGGLGIFMVKHMADAVEYRREGGRNVLTVRKRFLRE